VNSMENAAAAHKVVLMSGPRDLWMWNHGRANQTQTLEQRISRVKGGEPGDWRNRNGRDTDELGGGGSCRYQY